MVTEKDFETSHLRLEQDSGKKDAPVTPASMAGSLLLPVGLLAGIVYFLYHQKSKNQSALAGPAPAQVARGMSEVEWRHSQMELAPKTFRRQGPSEQEMRISRMFGGTHVGRSQGEVKGEIKRS